MPFAKADIFWGFNRLSADRFKCFFLLNIFFDDSFFLTNHF